MRKSTKLAILVAALVALCSIAALAADTWKQDGDNWYCYDKDGNMVYGEWKKSGSNYYYLDDATGAMATSKLIDNGGDAVYWVGEDGARVLAQWVKVPVENDGDGWEWMYFKAVTGKATKGDGTAAMSTINGKKYHFTTEGYMQYGYLNSSFGTESYASNAAYYFGSKEDGSAQTGWVNVTDGADENFDDKASIWFYFKKGAKVTDKVKYNGNYYYFNADKYGVMYYGWTNATSVNASASYVYLGGADDGVMKKSQWVKTDNFAEDGESSYWYYLKKDGTRQGLGVSKINGKYYLFAEANKGAMKTGIVIGTTSDVLDPTKFTYVGTASTMDAYKAVGDDLSADDFKKLAIMYFSADDTDGSMKVGTQTVTIDGEEATVVFDKHGYALEGVSSKKIYKNGILQSAGDSKVAVKTLRKADSTYAAGKYLVNAAGSILKNTKSSNSDGIYYVVNDNYNVIYKFVDKDTASQAATAIRNSKTTSTKVADWSAITFKVSGTEYVFTNCDPQSDGTYLVNWAAK